MNYEVEIIRTAVLNVTAQTRKAARKKAARQVLEMDPDVIADLFSVQAVSDYEVGYVRESSEQDYSVELLPLECNDQLLTALEEAEVPYDVGPEESIVIAYEKLHEAKKALASGGLKLQEQRAFVREAESKTDVVDQQA